MFELKKNAREVIRIYHSEFLNKNLIHIRIFYKDENNEFKPSKKGIAVKKEMLDDLINALLNIREQLNESSD